MAETVCVSHPGRGAALAVTEAVLRCCGAAGQHTARLSAAGWLQDTACNRAGEHGGDKSLMLSVGEWDHGAPSLKLLADQRSRPAWFLRDALA
jgi:hypothetical protein